MAYYESQLQLLAVVATAEYVTGEKVSPIPTHVFTENGIAHDPALVPADIWAVWSSLELPVQMLCGLVDGREIAPVADGYELTDQGREYGRIIAGIDPARR